MTHGEDARFGQISGVIPKEVRREIGLKPGQELEIVVRNGLLTLVPDVPLSSLRGFAKGVRTDNIREKKDRF